MPFTVAVLCALAIFGLRNKGLSKRSFGFILVALALYFFYHIVSNIDIGQIQVIAFMVFLPSAFLLGPLLLLFNESLLKQHFRYPPGFSKHFIASGLAALYAITLLIITPSEDYLAAINGSLIKESSFFNIAIAKLTQLIQTVVFYIHLLTYLYFINQRQDKHKQKFGKFYADYERRNENRMIQAFASIVGIIASQLILYVFNVTSNYVIIGLNIFSSAMIAIIFLAGKDQISIRKYRIYKLSSHEHEVAG